MLTSKVTADGRISLPRRVRQVLKLAAGADVEFVIENGRVLMRSPYLISPDSLAGSLRQYAKPGKSPREIREIVKKRVSRAASQEGQDE